MRPSETGQDLNANTCRPPRGETRRTGTPPREPGTGGRGARGGAPCSEGSGAAREAAAVPAAGGGECERSVRLFNFSLCGTERDQTLMAARNRKWRIRDPSEEMANAGNKRPHGPASSTGRRQPALGRCFLHGPSGPTVRQYGSPLRSRSPLVKQEPQ